MSDVLTIAGSPSKSSRSSAVLAYASAALQSYGLRTAALHVRDLDAGELLAARVDGPSIRDAVAQVAAARAIIIATPVYKAAYAGVLKAFLDLLPQDGLADKIVFPIATGGSAAHLLAIDYALKPVLFALGAQHVLSGLYIQDAQLQQVDGEIIALEAGIEKRLQKALLTLANHLAPAEITQAQPVAIHSFTLNSVALVR